MINLLDLKCFITHLNIKKYLQIYSKKKDVYLQIPNSEFQKKINKNPISSIQNVASVVTVYSPTSI